MISPDKIEEWIREVEERPSSASLILRYIANRLSELAGWNEELLAENIELRSGRKVEEYESRIASLEYQVGLLKRQLGGEIAFPVEVPAPAPLIETINLLIYNPLGQVLRMELNPSELVSSEPMAGFPGEVAPGDMIPSTLVTSSQEELLFVFDSGRTVAMPVTHLPLADPESLDWQQAFLEEPRIKEELATLHPIAKMSLYESCIQTSRRGFVKKIKASFFASYLTENFIGTGVKLPADKTCSLTFSGKEDLFVMVSQDGYIFSMEANRLPTAIEEVVHLGISDHIVSTFMVNQKPSILFITQNGKAVLRDVSWLEHANSFKTKGQPLLSKERREAGIRLVGSAPVDGADWCAVLRSDGSLTVHKLSDLFATGSVTPGQPSTTILGFSTFRMPDSK